MRIVAFVILRLPFAFNILCYSYSFCCWCCYLCISLALRMAEIELWQAMKTFKPTFYIHTQIYIPNTHTKPDIEMYNHNFASIRITKAYKMHKFIWNYIYTYICICMCVCIFDATLLTFYCQICSSCISLHVIVRSCVCLPGIWGIAFAF